MRGFFKNYIADNLWFKVLSGFAIGLFIASFILPPMGVIDASVLAAGGEIFAFSALGAVLKAMDKGLDAKVKKGDTELMIGDLNNEDKEDE